MPCAPGRFVQSAPLRANSLTHRAIFAKWAISVAHKCLPALRLPRYYIGSVRLRSSHTDFLLTELRGNVAMQLHKLCAASGLALTALLTACGGGGDDPAPAAPAVAAVTASAASQKSTQRAIVGTALQFDGGACGGGSLPVTATWDFGDKTPPSSDSTHTYASAGTYSVIVTCKDAKNVSKTSSPLSVVVGTEAMAGFLGREWSAYTTIDSDNRYVYPVAGIATSGAIDGIWLRSNVDEFGLYKQTTDVAAGKTDFNATSWTLSADPQPGTRDNKPTFDGTAWTTTAAMDMAISPSGKGLAAWRAGSADKGYSLWYATKDVSGTWSTPVQLNVPVVDASIKVVVNDAGDGAIAYCTGAIPSFSANVVAYSNASHTTGAPAVISQQCDSVRGSTGNAQRSRSFDIAITNPSSTIMAVGLTPSGSNSVVSVMSYTQAGGWTAATNLSGVLTDMPSNFSLSYSLSPNGNVAGVAWTEMGMPLAPYPATLKTNVMARIYAGGTWGAATPIVPLSIYEFSQPLIAVSDAGQAFLAMERAPTSASSYRTYVSNYTPTAGWRDIESTDSDLYPSSDYRLSASDIAIDKWGTGLLTRIVNSTFTQAGTFSIEGTWSRFSSISSSYSRFHYQTMRALPDGRAILVTSVGGTTPGSGYLLLK